MIDHVSEVHVGDASLLTRRYTVTYATQEHQSSIQEKDLDPDRLRLKLAPGMTLTDFEHAHAVQAAAEEAAAKNLDINTGFGEWSTVEVREFDEEEEAERIRIAQDAAERSRRATQKPKAATITAEYAPDMGDNALGAYNQTGSSYRGIELSKTTTSSSSFHQETERKLLKNASSMSSVAFKKRTGSSSSSKKRRALNE